MRTARALMWLSLPIKIFKIMGYSHYDVAHRYATGIGDHCNGDHVFFQGNRIYSYGYHFCIAEKWNGKLLFTESEYSTSTTKHKSIVLGACRQYEIIYVPTLDGASVGSERFVKDSLTKWAGQCREIIEGPMAKARKPELYMSKVLGIVGRVEVFCKEFKVKVPKWARTYKNTMSMESVLEAARETAKWVAEQKRKREQEAAEKFMRGEINSYCGDYQIVRFSEEKQRFETSMHVWIPLEAGRRFYEALKAGTLKVGDSVLYYRVRAVGSEIKIGCHTFKRAWLLNYGKKMFATA